MSVTPSQVLQGTRTDVQIQGRNFLTQLTMDVDSRSPPIIRRDFAVRIGGDEVPTGDVMRVDATQIEITVPDDLVVGRYDVDVRTPAGRWASLRGAITVFARDRIADGGTSGTSGLAGTAGATLTQSGTGGMPGTSPSNLGGSTTGSSDTLVYQGGAQTGGGSRQMAAGTSSASVSLGGTGGLTATTMQVAGKGSQVAGGGMPQSSTSAGTAGTMLPVAANLWTDGRNLRDTCGNALQLRGVQQLLGRELPQGNDWVGIIDSIAASGANVVRLHPDIAVLGTTGVEAVLARIKSWNLIAILNPESDTWLADPNTKSMLAKYRDRLIIDAFGPAYDDRARFVTDAKARVTKLRGFGYQTPLIVLSNAYGRDLPAILGSGAQIVETDPQRNLVFEWDAYWGSGGWYQKQYGMSLEQGVAAAVSSGLPILMGLTLVTDSNPTQLLDYDTAMTAAQKYGLGWLWWDWHNPYGSESSLSADGTATNLLTVGIAVVRNHPAGLAHTVTSPCTGW